jgi:hypothetical protein
VRGFFTFVVAAIFVMADITAIDYWHLSGLYSLILGWGSAAIMILIATTVLLK